jgi:ABC-type transport system substrate-binding protein
MVMRSRRVVLAVSVVLAAAPAGCSSDGNGSSPGSSASTPATGAPTTDASTTTDASATTGAPATTNAGEPEGSDTTVYEQGDIDEGLRPFIDEATDDLATRLAIDPADVEVLSAVLVTWPDASLGCPQPGMQYAQVLTDGSIIELGVGEGDDMVVHRYHTGGSSGPFLCDQPLDRKPAAGG